MSRRRTDPLTLIALAASVLGAWLLMACGRSPGAGGPRPAFLDLPERPVPGRVYVVAIDGASWSVFDEVLAAGLMPNLAGVVERGVRADLRSMDPTASAILWTTIATGKRPEKHGILGFVSRTPEGQVVPVSSPMRRVRALWNILSEAGVSVGFLSWWVSWPAEPVRGYLASDYVWPLAKDAQGFATGAAEAIDLEDRTYPRELMAELDRFNLTEARAGAVELARLGIDAIPRHDAYAVRDIFLKDVSVSRMAEHLLESGPPVSLFAVYYDGFDAFCHLFWPHYRDVQEARRAGAPVLAALHPAQLAIAGALDQHLRRIDASIGTIVDRMRPEDTLLVISDHGYGDNPERLEILRTFDETIRPEHWHTQKGLFAAAGGPIQRQAGALEATVLDIAPTILALLGLPVADDMDGRPLLPLLHPDFLAAHPIAGIPTYDSTPRSGAATASPFDDERLEQLRQLGYLGDK